MPNMYTSLPNMDIGLPKMYIGIPNMYSDITEAHKKMDYIWLSCKDIAFSYLFVLHIM